jgi:hypothetical protein
MQMYTLTRGQLRAGIALAGVNCGVLAAEAGISRGTLRGWLNDGKSNETFPANLSYLARLVAAIELRGVRFTQDGVVLQRERGASPVAMAATA